LSIILAEVELKKHKSKLATLLISIGAKVILSSTVNQQSMQVAK